ncbi:MAG: hypothetical protein KC731_37270 [Myxococcales bacterium]|nr:hypothetical protein [Myxococcales bacterium]
MKARLERYGAPPELAAWLRDVGAADAWDGSDKPEWLLWLGAAAETPVEQLLEAVGGVVRSVIEGYPEPLRAPLDGVFANLRGEVDALAAALQQAEGYGHGPPASYRHAPPAGYVHGVRAAVLFGRATEALVAAEARLAAVEGQAALERAAAVGVPPSLMTRRLDPLVLRPVGPGAGPLQQELGYAVALASDALEEASLALAGGHDGVALEEAEGELSEFMHTALEDLRDDVIARLRG